MGHRIERYLRYHKQKAERSGQTWLLLDQEARTLLASDCHYCGLPVIPGNPCLLDVADPALGFTPNNSRATCLSCHIALNQKGSEGEFVQWARDVVSTMKHVR